MPSDVTTGKDDRHAQGRARLGKLLFVFAAGVSFLLSVYLWFNGQREEGLFVGLWVPSILSLGALVFASKTGRTAARS